MARTVHAAEDVFQPLGARLKHIPAGAQRQGQEPLPVALGRVVRVCRARVYMRMGWVWRGCQFFRPPGAFLFPPTTSNQAHQTLNTHARTVALRVRRGGLVPPARPVEELGGLGQVRDVVLAPRHQRGWCRVVKRGGRKVGQSHRLLRRAPPAPTAGLLQGHRRHGHPHTEAAAGINTKRTQLLLPGSPVSGQAARHLSWGASRRALGVGRGDALGWL